MRFLLLHGFLKVKIWILLSKITQCQSFIIKFIYLSTILHQSPLWMMIVWLMFYLILKFFSYLLTDSNCQARRLLPLLVQSGQCQNSKNSFEINVSNLRLKSQKKKEQSWRYNLSSPTHLQILFKADRRQIITPYQLTLISIRLRSITHCQLPMSH